MATTASVLFYTPIFCLLDFQDSWQSLGAPPENSSYGVPPIFVLFALGFLLYIAARVWWELRKERLEL